MEYNRTKHGTVLHLLPVVVLVSTSGTKCPRSVSVEKVYFYFMLNKITIFYYLILNRRILRKEKKRMHTIKKKKGMKKELNQKNKQIQDLEVKCKQLEEKVEKLQKKKKVLKEQTKQVPPQPLVHIQSGMFLQFSIIYTKLNYRNIE